MAVALRIINYLGRALMTAGVVLLLFVVYQLWGTGIHTAEAQDDLEDEMVASLSEPLPGTEGEDGGPLTSVPVDSSTAPVDRPVTLGDGKGLGETFGLTPAQIAKLPPPGLSESAGYISIPRIRSNWWYVEGVDLAWLRDGPGHFPGTVWPGQEGNAALAGHRTTYGAPFHRIDELEPGDELLFETPQGEFRYEVVPRGELWDDMPIADRSDPDSGHFIITPDDDWILDDYGDDRITLMACNPKYSAAQRIVVVGRLVGEVAPKTPPSVDLNDPEVAESPLVAFDQELIGSDPTARLPAILWALAAASVWLLVLEIGRTWRKARWPTYAFGLPVFLLTLFICFTYVEQLLPAGY